MSDLRERIYDVIWGTNTREDARIATDEIISMVVDECVKVIRNRQITRTGTGNPKKLTDRGLGAREAYQDAAKVIGNISKVGNDD